MLSRLLPRPSHFRRFMFITSKSISNPQPHFANSFNISSFRYFSRYFSTNGSDNNNGRDQSSSTGGWKDFREKSEDKFDSMFGGNDGRFDGFNEGDDGDKDHGWLEEKGLDNEDEDAIFKGVDKKNDEKGVADFGNQLWYGSEQQKPWTLQEEGKDVFNFQDVVKNVGEFRPDSSPVESERMEGQIIEDPEKLEKEEKQLTAVVKGKLEAFSSHDTKICIGSNAQLGM